ncbi:hypothetical protein I3842_02G006500 [Carya illinoinensis]|uniref:Uncharacterized protein n=1 Tax=Carya illinoinensis TaxID=32201 RepID=A0A922FQW3_CARIL|nr:hypothetical protein I3842_02G006500 [Carya illinoinensis]
MKNKKSTFCERSSNSLTNRWSTIQHATTKFCGALAQIEGRSPSGVTEQDKRLKLDQQREYKKIMRIDISSLPPMQQEYFRCLQLKIL